MTLFCKELSFLCVCTLLADVASTEQQQSAKDSSKAHEEEEVEDTSVDPEEQEELRAVDTEPLKPEEVKSGSTAQPGEWVLWWTPPSHLSSLILVLLSCLVCSFYILTHDLDTHVSIVTPLYILPLGVERWGSGVTGHWHSRRSSSSRQNPGSLS